MKNPVDKNMRTGEHGWKASKHLHKSKKKYNRKKFKKITINND